MNKKTTAKATTGAAAKKKPPVAKKGKKTTTAEKGEGKSAQATAPKATKKTGNEKPKEKKAKKKEDDVQVMTLEMIEEKFEKQTKAYNQRIMNYMRVEQRPLTLALICKYAFPKPPQPRHATEPIVDETSEKPSEATQSTKEESGY